MINFCNKYVSSVCLSLVDHTSLNETDDFTTIKTLCEEAADVEKSNMEKEDENEDKNKLEKIKIENSTEQNGEKLKRKRKLEENKRKKRYVAAVCVLPKFVKFIKDELCNKIDGLKKIKIATVLNFPHGDEKLEEILALTREVLADGADELDLVINYKKIKNNKTKIEGLADTEELIYIVKEVIHNFLEETRKNLGTSEEEDEENDKDIKLKIIMETGELNDEKLIEETANTILNCNVDFLKTSTGKVPTNATIDYARILLNCIKIYEEKKNKINYVLGQEKIMRSCGIKIAGGIRTIEQAAEYLNLAEQIIGVDWINKSNFRFGTSSLLKILRNNLMENKNVI